MTDTEQLIAELDCAREEMHTLLRALDSAQEVYPDWTVKELLAHLTGWDDANIAALRAHARGDAPATPASRGIDLYNASTVLERQALSLAQVIAEWEQTRETLKQILRALPPEKLAQPLVMPWGPTSTVAEMVHTFADHEREHVEEIRKRLETR